MSPEEMWVHFRCRTGAMEPVIVQFKGVGIRGDTGLNSSLLAVQGGDFIERESIKLNRSYHICVPQMGLHSSY